MYLHLENIESKKVKKLVAGEANHQDVLTFHKAEKDTKMLTAIQYYFYRLTKLFPIPISTIDFEKLVHPYVIGRVEMEGLYKHPCE